MKRQDGQEHILIVPGSNTTFPSSSVFSVVKVLIENHPNLLDKLVQNQEDLVSLWLRRSIAFDVFPKKPQIPPRSPFEQPLLGSSPEDMEKIWPHLTQDQQEMVVLGYKDYPELIPALIRADLDKQKITAALAHLTPPKTSGLGVKM